jgi:hypothetical protein
MGNPAAGLARADEVAGAPWDAAAVEPVAKGFFRDPPPPEQLDEYRRIALMASHVAAVEAARSNARSWTLQRLGEIRVPTLIIPTIAREEPDERRRSDRRRIRRPSPRRPCA